MSTKRRRITFQVTVPLYWESGDRRSLALAIAMTKDSLRSVAHGGSEGHDCATKVKAPKVKP